MHRASSRSADMSMSVLPVAVTVMATAAIPFNTLPGGGRLPLLVMGDGVNWGRGTNWSQWVQLVGKGAGIDSAWDYGSQPGIPKGLAGVSGLKREVRTQATVNTRWHISITLLLLSWIANLLWLRMFSLHQRFHATIGMVASSR